jgi:hypothetical protein
VPIGCGKSVPMVATQVRERGCPSVYKHPRRQGTLSAVGVWFAFLFGIEERFLLSRQEPLLRCVIRAGSHSRPQCCYAARRVSSRTSPSDRRQTSHREHSYAFGQAAGPANAVPALRG